MNGRALSIFVGLSFAVPLAIAPSPARGQVSDADRNAARDLYNEGWQLQQQGRYADAVDRYTRSLAVFPAPTTAFRLAQCKEALGKLVEAAEELRAIRNAPLPAGSPQAFVTAQQDAAAEVPKLEARIPKIKIEIQPAGISGLVVTVDGATMPTALVGVARPIDPGSHTITATAPGYSQAQARVDVREKQTPMPEVTLTLQASAAGPTYQAGGPTYQTGGPTYQTGGPYGGGYQGTTGYSPYNTWVPPRRRPQGPRNALLIGIDGALSVPFGNVYGGDLTQELSAGGGGGLDIGLRLARMLYLGANAELNVFSNSNGTLTGGQGYTLALDGVLGIITNPEGFGFYGELGPGVRFLSVTTPTSSTSFSMTSFDFVFGVGFQVKAGSFRFVPKIDFYVGPNSGTEGAHGFFALGLAGFWELPFVEKKPAQPAEVPATPATATTPAE